MKNLIPFTPTLVGSLPHKDPATAARLVAGLFPEIPAWPQLPVYHPREGMYPQVADGFPGVRIGDDGRVTVQMDDQSLDKIDALLAGRVSPEELAPVPEAISGLEALLDFLAAEDSPSGGWLKGQISGPVSFGLSVTEPDGKSILYNPLLREVTTAHLAAKARWFRNTVSSRVPGRTPIIFFDEPYLSSYGSAFFPLERQEVISLLTEVVERVPGPVGIHCCGNTDWSLVMACGADVLNLDAYSYWEGLTLYPEELKTFLGNGGRIAWGLIPTDREPEGLTAEDIKEHFENILRRLTDLGVKDTLLLSQSLITPACGMGTRSIKGAEKIARLTVETAGLLNKQLRT